MSTYNEDKTVEVYSLGICAASVCAVNTMTSEEVVAEVNRITPTGISSDWELSSDKTFKNGEPHPCVCESDRGRQHWLMVC